MFNEIYPEVMQNLTYNTILWYMFYKNLEEVYYMKILSNLEGFEKFITAHTQTITHTYEYLEELEHVHLIIDFIIDSVKCMVKYDHYVYTYISIITNNIKLLPPSISQVQKIEQPPKNDVFIKMLKTCYGIKKYILEKSGQTTLQRLSAVSTSYI